LAADSTLSSNYQASAVSWKQLLLDLFLLFWKSSLFAAMRFFSFITSHFWSIFVAAFGSGAAV